MRKMIVLTALLLSGAMVRAQNAHPLVQPRWHFVDETGAPCVGCKLTSYLAGTTTQTPTYTDYLEVNQNTNPIILNAAGEAQIWVGTPTIKLVLQHADGSLIWTVDHIPTWGTGGGGGGGCTTVGAGGVIQASDGAGGCAAAHVQVNGLNLLQDTTPNFVDTPGVQFQNPSGNQITASGTVIRVNDVATTPVSPVNLNDALPLPDTGYINAKVRQDGSANVSFEVPATTPPDITPLVTAPVAGQYVILRPHRFTITRRDFAPGSIVGSADGQNASGYISMGNTCSLSYTNIGTWDQYSLADYGINPANVTAVYAFGVSGISSTDANTFCYPTLADPNWASTSLVNASAVLSLPANQPSSTQQTTGLTGLAGSGIATASTVAQMTVTGATRLFTNYNIDSVGLIVYYTGTPVTVPDRLYVQAPVNYDSNAKKIYLDQSFPSALKGWPIGHTPDPTLAYSEGIIINGTIDCVTASGDPNDSAWCKPVNTGGSTFAWGPFPGGSGGSGTVTNVATGSGLNGGPITTTGTVACNTASSSVVGCVKVDGTTITASGGVISAVGGGSVSGSGTTGFLPKWSGSTTLGNSLVDDGITTASTLTVPEKLAVVVAGGQGGTLDLTEGTTATAATGHDVLYADSTAHCIKQSLNNGAFACLGTGSGGLSGMTAGQVPIAATASTVTSSKAIQGTDTNLLSSGTISGSAGVTLCTDANGGATTSSCTSGSSTVNSGSGYAIPAYGSAASTTVGPSNITSAASLNDLNVPGTVAVGTGAHVTIGAVGSPTNWTLDTTSAATARTSLGISVAGTLSPAPPYLTDGTHFFDRDGYQITKPLASPTWLNTTPTSVTAGANGNVIVASTGSGHQIWESQTCTTSVEVVMRGYSSDLSTITSSNAPSFGAWIYDSTGSKVYNLQLSYYNTGKDLNALVFTYSGSGSPSFSSSGTAQLFGSYGLSDYIHLKLVKVSTTLNLQVSVDGGATYQTLFTQSSIGTISKCGYVTYSPTGNTYVNVISEEIH